MDSFTFGALSAGVGVALGAFGAHGLKTRFQNYPIQQREYFLDIWKTASFYHLIHSVAICIAPKMAKSAGWGPLSSKFFAAGIALFSGSLYGITLTEEKKLGMITPLGGLCFIAGWIALAFRK